MSILERKTHAAKSTDKDATLKIARGTGSSKNNVFEKSSEIGSQLSLKIPTERPAMYAIAAPQAQPGGLPYWQMQCGYSRKKFMGIWTLNEVNRLLREFEDRTSRISQAEFAQFVFGAMKVGGKS